MTKNFKNLGTGFCLMLLLTAFTACKDNMQTISVTFVHKLTGKISISRICWPGGTFRFLFFMVMIYFQEQKFENLAYFEPFYLKDFVATVSKKNVLG